MSLPERALKGEPRSSVSRDFCADPASTSSPLPTHLPSIRSLLVLPLCFKLYFSKISAYLGLKMMASHSAFYLVKWSTSFGLKNSFF